LRLLERRDSPPLRERGEDIGLLVEHVRRQVNARYGLSVAGVTQEALDVLRGHSWPGNVRELEPVLDQAMIFQGGSWLKSEDIELPLGRSPRRAPSEARATRAVVRGEERLRGQCAGRRRSGSWPGVVG